jgi:aspartate carbamoyltransferase catalytic subunit
MIEFKGKDILSAKQFSKEELEYIFKIAAKMEPIARGEENSDLLQNKYLATLFFEASTRTRLSFEIAMLRLGGKVINSTGITFSSLIKGETLHDTARVVSNFVDVIAIRHPEIGSAEQAAHTSNKPVINAGDGPGQHPTQALLDLYTIKKEKKRIDKLTVAMVGDLKYGRTIHSLAYLLAHYDVTIYFVSPDILKMPKGETTYLKEKGINFKETSDLGSVLPELDVLYDTRIQKERFADPIEFERVKNCYVINKKLLEKAKNDITIMHPLPRLEEISTEVDSLPNAAYFRQTFYGVPIRMALLALVLGQEK